MQESRLKSFASEGTLYLHPLGRLIVIRAFWLCLRRSILARGHSSSRYWHKGTSRRAPRCARYCTPFLGACYALKLPGAEVHHIHVHHGYFASWIAMVAARLLHIDYSLTLHGSDLLLHGAYLDIKLRNCAFCVTVSEFNRRFVLSTISTSSRAKSWSSAWGWIRRATAVSPLPAGRGPKRLILLVVGRLHPVKDHAFLFRACHELKKRGTDFVCLVAGEGPQRRWLEHLIPNLRLEKHVKLLGHLSRQELDAQYESCDVVVLTSRSEGIPLVLMEAMALGKTVLAPAITGIPELVKDGETGFLYRAGSLEDFTAKIETIRSSPAALPQLRRAARQHVLEHFDRKKNLAALADLLISRITQKVRHNPNENPVLQQI